MNPLLIKTQALARLQVTAVKADEKIAIDFLTANGFKGLKRKADMNNLMSFFYQDYDPKHLTRYLGQPSEDKGGVTRWHVGKAGSIGVLPEKKIVRLINNGGAGAEMPHIMPIETHVPPHVETPTQKKTPVQPKQSPLKKPVAPAPVPPDKDPKTKLPPSKDPNIPGAKDNDNSGVPVVKLNKQLDDQYFVCQQNPGNAQYQMRFMKALWTHFNSEKFGGKLQMPTLALLKNQSGLKMRLRGRWWPLYKRLDIAPRLFNASLNFFVEIFLHEMCHQAVTEIDKMSDDPSNKATKGHGPHWQSWMKRVGLNPLRFDPNDNTTYMNEQEKHDYALQQKQKLEQKEKMNNEVKEQGLKQMWNLQFGKLATAKWTDKLIHGMLVCPNDKAGKRWAFIDASDVYSTSFKILPPSFFYEFAGNMDVIQPKLEAMKAKAERTRNYIEKKSAIKSDKIATKKYLKTLLGF